MAAPVLDPETRLAHVTAAADALRTQLPESPRIGILTSSATAPLTSSLSATKSVSFDDLPHLPHSEDAKGRRFVAGVLHGQPVLALPHQLHLYDGLSAREVAMPIRIMAALGVTTIVAVSAAGSVNPNYHPGDVMLLNDHINLQGDNPLEGPNVDAWGPRFPDMSDPYDADLRQVVHDAALEAGTRLQDGIYLGVPGPNLQTKAEYRFMRNVGADAVGTSLIPEVIAARHMDLRVLAGVVITDACFADTLEPTEATSVADAAERGRTRMADVLEHLMPRL